MSELIGKALEETNYENLENINDSNVFQVVAPVVALDNDDLSDCLIDKNDFQSGIKSVSKVAGMVTGLLNVGVTPAQALNYIMTLQIENSKQENLKNILDRGDVGKKEDVAIQRETISTTKEIAMANIEMQKSILLENEIKREMNSL